MPIFQDDLGRGRSTPPTNPAFTFPGPPGGQQIRRDASEESIRTELCEGPLLGSLSSHGSPREDLASNTKDPPAISDRSELIQRLKNGESPAWLPNRNVSEHFPTWKTAGRIGTEALTLQHQVEAFLEYDTRSPSRTQTRDSPRSSPLLPAAEIKGSSPELPSTDTEAMEAGLSIERPRSALHTGDFTQKRAGNRGPEQPISSDEYQTYKEHRPPSWLATSPPRDFTTFRRDPRFSPINRPAAGYEARSRAPSVSSSLSSSFAFKAPTSPLVQSESNDELEFSESNLELDAAFHRNLRRHTMHMSHSFSSNPSLSSAATLDRHIPSLRRDNSYPYQAHQPRRSVTVSMGFHNTESSPQTPLTRSRRPSIASDFSPLNRASMVGSYEESIINGRMSTAPSEPLDFIAQIGVLGLGKCKSNLKCPPHVTLKFPAVFYSYNTTAHGRPGRIEDGPSPYVGAIDLENGLPNPDEEDERRRSRRNAKRGRQNSEDIEMLDAPEVVSMTDREIRRAERQKKPLLSPKAKAPPGGSYRIPEKGQLQIVIKNPNKTAVKLFLIPYDLAGMEPGTKTFIRQRILSKGPIIDSKIPSSAQKGLRDGVEGRETLRYLAHLNICCTSKGRFYLYKRIRIVFANRVPDGKEKLQNIIQTPEPRFSVYKPGRDSNIGTGNISGPGASLAAEKAFRRRSAGFTLGSSQREFDTMNGEAQSLGTTIVNAPSYPHARAFSTTPIEPIPFSLYQPRSRIPGEDNLLSPTSSRSSRPTTAQGSGASASWNSSSSSTGIGGYDKLNKGDIGYGGNAFSDLHHGHQSTSEGLLARKLKSLGERRDENGDGI